MKTYWTLYFDGACEPKNPGGTASYGWVLLRPDGWQHSSGSGIHCEGAGATNNVAEYAALIAGVRHFLGVGSDAQRLRCRGDSMLVVQQIQGRWQCRKDHLRLLRDEALALLGHVVHWRIEWIPRAENSPADHLSRHHASKNS